MAHRIKGSIPCREELHAKMGAADPPKYNLASMYAPECPERARVSPFGQLENGTVHQKGTGHKNLKKTIRNGNTYILKNIKILSRTDEHTSMNSSRRWVVLNGSGQYV